MLFEIIHLLNKRHSIEGGSELGCVTFLRHKKFVRSLWDLSDKLTSYFTVRGRYDYRKFPLSYPHLDNTHKTSLKEDWKPTGETLYDTESNKKLKLSRFYSW